MSLLVEMKKMKFCPLCRRKWTVLEEAGKLGKAYFVCNWCKIICWVRDHFVGRWEEMRWEDPTHCPRCRNHTMHFFCRADGYCKWYCMDCKAEIETFDPDKHAHVTKTLDELKKEMGGT